MPVEIIQGSDKQVTEYKTFIWQKLKFIQLISALKVRCHGGFFVLSVFRTRIRSSKSYGGFVTDYLSITVLTSGRCEYLLAQLLCTSKPIKLNSNPGVLFLVKFSEIFKNTSYFMQQGPCIGGVHRLILY